MTPKNIIEVEVANKLKSKPEKAAAVNAVVEFEITGAGGGTWTVDCTKAGGEVKSGSSGVAKLTITISSADFVDLFEGKLGATSAFLAGKIKVKGDMGLAMKLGNIL